ncbi:MAG: FHA domain-containing protein [Lachnospiraceae bacterium]|nr:FHA domain-containing protein [Lachnospiraceae bacterium]
MIEAKYFKDYKHNYMILKCEDTGMGENYLRSMLAYNKIDGIVKCSVRNVNGEVYLYYDISSKITFENLYQGKKMSYEQVRDFFSQIDMIYRNLGQFFMEERGLLMQPDCIFYDFTSKKYSGLYYPIADLQSKNSFEPLMDYLLNHLDTGNQKLADIIYQIYELSESPFFSVADALAFFDEPEDIKEVVTVIDNGSVLGDGSIAETGTIGGNTAEYIETGNENFYAHHEIEGQTEQKKNTIYYTIFTIVSVCGIGAVLWIYNNYELTPRELMMIMCCMAVMGLCLIFSIAQVLLSGKRMQKKEQEERELLRDIEDEFREESNVALQNVLDKNMGMTSAGNIRGTDTRLIHNEQEHNEGYSKTIFMDVKMQDTEYKLYALDNKNKRHIELTKFPFTIGKMAGCVDCVLLDDSVSRLHARIEKQGDKILLTDMNSMNGTYKNGLRMEPSETVEIVPGDEIRFGKLNYCYR